MTRLSSSHHLLILGLALAVSTSCRERDKTGASESKPAPASSDAAPAPAATTTAAPAAGASASTSAKATTETPAEKSATAAVVDSTVVGAPDSAGKGPSAEAALMGKPRPGTPVGATAECKDGGYSMSKETNIACQGHGGVKKWLKP